MWEVCMCGWETGVRRQSLRNSILRTFLAMSYPTPTFWQHLSLVWSSLINLDCQASEPQGSPCLCLPETGITSMSHHSQPFYVGSEYQIHFTWLVWQAFLPTEPSLQTYGCVGGGGGGQCVHVQAQCYLIKSAKADLKELYTIPFLWSWILQMF